ncbi:phospholipase D/nuclease [Trichocladium antarcticum]|uniref:Phospholipase n=1 Tax=Trichocladium antarcticum TaxID=1450529 RepID=A0AAN6Z9R9_9PEZI|nr:phospholipase D/nuclease [Trichocladium antarcticum]
MATGPTGAEAQSKHHGIRNKLKLPFRALRDKVHHASSEGAPLHNAKVHMIHQKHKIGKLGNLFNPQHRHDEEHEKACDEKRSRICGSHRFQSYFPERDGNMVKWYVDGRDYFWAVSVALEKAKETIYIEDWWLSPELFLRRPPSQNPEWRLDQVLKRRAEAGVKIYIVVYREVEAALTCNSAHTKHALQALCPEGTPGHGNIKIMRHPDHNVLENAADMTFYWAHHEKFIVIDYEMAFIGGLDLCFGRWDNHQHALSDWHPEGNDREIWPGQDFNNNRVLDFKNVQDWEQNELDKSDSGRMPWHDVAMGVIGPCVYDIAEHFVLRWNFVKRDKYKRNKQYEWIELRGRQGEDEDLVGVQRPKHPVGGYVLHPHTGLETKNLEGRGTVRAQIVRSCDDWSSGVLTDHSIQNAYSDVIRNAQHYVYIENQFFITATGDQQLPIRNTIGRAIVDAVVRAAKEQRKFRVIILIPSVPGFAGDLRDDAAVGTRAIMDYQYKSICRGEHSIFSQIRKEGVDPNKHVFFFNLRSYDRLNKTPSTKKQDDGDMPRAEAAGARADGVRGSEDGAAQEGLDEGRIPDTVPQAADAPRQCEGARNGEPPGAHAVASVAHHAMAGDGTVSEAPWAGDDADEINQWIQEELYIHAKLLIADDRVVICGSSNLNDRSQLGYHDSELSIVMEDTRRLQSSMDGRPFDAGYHAATLRRYLWREHLGLLPPQDHDATGDPNAMPPGDGSPNDVRDGDASWAVVEDPLSDELWEMWTARATVNTEVFRQLFHADPDDYVKTFIDYNVYMAPKGVRPGHVFDRMIPPHEARAKLDRIKGHLVWMPMDFLRDAEMAEKGLQVNQWTESVYT